MLKIQMRKIELGENLTNETNGIYSKIFNIQIFIFLLMIKRLSSKF